MNQKNNGLSVFFLLFFTSILRAQPALVLETFATGLSAPVDIAHAADDRLFVVEKSGLIKIVRADGSVISTPYLDIRGRVDDTDSETGLLGLAFHPNYADNGFFFVNYTDNNGDTRVSRFRRDPTDPNRADPNTEKIILSVQQPQSNHNGGDLAFGPDGFLYIALGDGGGAGDPGNYAQTRGSLLGKLLRIDINTGEAVPYAIPPGNPYANNPNVRDEIWAIGLRNPWRFSFDRTTGDLWIADVGQGKWEEVNFRPAGGQGGENYGWRCFEAEAVYNSGTCGAAGAYAAPIYAYTHRSGSCGGSITGGFVYRGTQHPDLVGHYVYGDYCTGVIAAISPNGSGGWKNQNLLNWDGFQIASFGENADGELFMAALRQGVIYQVRTTVSGQLDPLPGLKEVRIAPNPFRHTLHLSGKSDLTADFTIMLYDRQGRMVFQRVEPLSGNFSTEYDLGFLAPGVYLLRISRGGQSSSWKVVRQ